MMALVTHPHWVTEPSVQEREPLAGAHATVHTSTLSAVVLCVGRVCVCGCVGACREGGVEELVAALIHQNRGSPCDGWQ